MRPLCSGFGLVREPDEWVSSSQSGTSAWARTLPAASRSGPGAKRSASSLPTPRLSSIASFEGPASCASTATSIPAPDRRSRRRVRRERPARSVQARDPATGDARSRRDRIRRHLRGRGAYTEKCIEYGCRRALLIDSNETSAWMRCGSSSRPSSSTRAISRTRCSWPASARRTRSAWHSTSSFTRRRSCTRST